MLEQFALLTRDVEQRRWDAGVTIMVNNGQLDIRGMGTIADPAQASAILFMALKQLPPVSHSIMLEKLSEIMARSEQIEKEAPLWRSSEK